MNQQEDLKKRFKKGLKKILRDLYWSFFKIKITRPPTPISAQSFLFICRGNICRSPFAEHLARRITEDKGVSHFRFGSAGMEVGKAVPPPETAKEVAKTYGVTLDDHLSKSINEIDLKAYDMVIAMEERQLKDLVDRFPELQNKVFLLPLFQPMNSNPPNGFLRYNIPDPYGNGRDEFIRCFNRIKLCVERLLVEAMQG